MQHEGRPADVGEPIWQPEPRRGGGAEESSLPRRALGPSGAGALSSRSPSSTCPTGGRSAGHSVKWCRQDGAAAAGRRGLLPVARAGLGAARGAVPLPAVHRRAPGRLPSAARLPGTRRRPLPGAGARARLRLLPGLRPLRRGVLWRLHAALRHRAPLLPAPRRRSTPAGARPGAGHLHRRLRRPQPRAPGHG